MIRDEDLTLIIDDQLFFEMILLEIRGKCISHATYKKKEIAKLETKKMTDVKFTERTLTKTMCNFWNKKTRTFLNKTEKGRWNDYQITCKMDW